MFEYFSAKKGQWVAVWCVRYAYRGRVKEVFDEGVILENPYAVETSGRATANKTQVEDKIPSDLFISFGAIEITCQPTWVNHLNE